MSNIKTKGEGIIDQEKFTYEYEYVGIHQQSYRFIMTIQQRKRSIILNIFQLHEYNPDQDVQVVFDETLQFLLDYISTNGLKDWRNIEVFTLHNKKYGVAVSTIN